MAILIDFWGVNGLTFEDPVKKWAEFILYGPRWELRYDIQWPLTIRDLSFLKAGHTLSFKTDNKFPLFVSFHNQEQRFCPFWETVTAPRLNLDSPWCIYWRTWVESAKCNFLSFHRILRQGDRWLILCRIRWNFDHLV